MAPPEAISAGYTERDLRAYFAGLEIAMPEVIAIGVESDGSVGANLPGVRRRTPTARLCSISRSPRAVAPKAKIVVYFALNTDNGFQAALHAAIHDKVHRPAVVSISWGSSEDDNTGQALRAFNEALRGRRRARCDRLLLGRRRWVVGCATQGSGWEAARGLSGIESVHAGVRRYEAPGVQWRNRGRGRLAHPRCSHGRRC